MAGKAGAAAEVMQRVALAAALLLERATQALADAPPPEDGAAVEKLAKQLKAVTDAGRSAVALETACARTAADPAPAAGRPDSEEMDMDDEPRASRSPAEVLELRAELDRQLERVLGRGDQKSAHRHAGAGRRGGDPLTVGDHQPARAAPA